MTKKEFMDDAIMNPEEKEKEYFGMDMSEFWECQYCKVMEHNSVNECQCCGYISLHNYGR